MGDITPLVLCPYQHFFNFFGKLETVLQQVSPLKPHCGKTENAADLSAWSIFTRQRRYFSFPFINKIAYKRRKRNK